MSEAAFLVPPGEAALVTTDGMNGLELLVPGVFAGGGDKLVPKMVLFLTSCYLRGQEDDDFVKEQVQWFLALPKG